MIYSSRKASLPMPQGCRPESDLKRKFLSRSAGAIRWMVVGDRTANLSCVGLRCLTLQWPRDSVQRLLSRDERNILGVIPQRAQHKHRLAENFLRDATPV